MSCKVNDLEAYRDFFAQWRKSLSWDKKRIRIIILLNRLQRSYRKRFDSSVPTINATSPLFIKLLDCFMFHGRKYRVAPPASSDFFSTTIRLLKTNKPDDSNPIEDLILADSAIAEINEGQTQAKEFLEKRFLRFVVKEALRQGAKNPSNLNEYDFLLHCYYKLVGICGKKPALARYDGRVGLGLWIGRHVCQSPNFSYRELIVEEDVKLPDNLPDPEDSAFNDSTAKSGEIPFDDCFRVWQDVSYWSKYDKIKADLKRFLKTRKPLEKLTLIYWRECIRQHWLTIIENERKAWEKTPLFEREKKEPEEFANRKKYGKIVLEIREDEIREARRLCGDGLKTEAFVLGLKKKLERFFEKFRLLEETNIKVVVAFAAWFCVLFNMYIEPPDKKEIADDKRKRLS